MRAEAQVLEIRAPAEQTEGTRSQVLRWLKAVGDRVALNEPLIELETDKVTVEVAAPGSGVLQEILKQEQEAVDPGDLLGRIDASTGASAGAMPRSEVPRAVGSVSAPAGVANDRSAAHLLSPAVRRLLDEHSVDPSSIEGSGQGGRITVQDVLRAVSHSTQSGVGATETEAPEGQIRRVPHSAVRKRIAEHMTRSLLHTAPHVTTVFEADMSAVLRHR